jgi:hypothetical protein
MRPLDVKKRLLKAVKMKKPPLFSLLACSKEGKLTPRIRAMFSFQNKCLIAMLKRKTIAK